MIRCRNCQEAIATCPCENSEQVYVAPEKCETFIADIPDGTVDLYLIDPPYFGITEDSWDNQWKSVSDYTDWMMGLFRAVKPKLKPNASVIFFGGIGKHGHRPFFKLIDRIEQENLFHYRNLITWGKRRGYGKAKDYLFCREEIAWYSMSPERTEVIFNIPLTDVKRGYAGFNKKFPAKSEFKRVTNVWSDLPELQRPSRSCQKPLPLMERLIRTHSNPGDLILDTFAGWGSTGIAARSLGRHFIGCEAIAEDAATADERVRGTVFGSRIEPAPVETEEPEVST